MRKNREILLVFLLLFLISCKGKNNVEQQFTQPESMQIIPDKEPPFINSGAINIVNKLNIRNAPSINGKILRQSSFGDCFKIWEKRGNKTINNGVLDLWYKISADKEEWINALYLRSFPFFISSVEKLNNEYSDEEYSRITMKIEGYREINGKKELMADIDSIDRGTDPDTNFRVYFTPVEFRGSIELQEEYSFNSRHREFKYISDYIQSEYKITLIDNTFENLRTYSLEIEEISNLYNRFFDFVNSNPEGGGAVYLDGNEVYFDNDDIDYEDYKEGGTWIKTITINSSKIVLTGIRIGSARNDIFVQFGDDFISDEHLSKKNNFEQIIYSLGYSYHDSYYPIRIKFDIVDDKVEKIIYSMKFTK
jgi:hypothetical protein